MYSQKCVSATRKRLEEAFKRPLKEYSYTQVQDFAARLKDIDWEARPSREIIAELPTDIQHYIWNDLNLSKIDFRYFLTRYCLILTDEKRLEPLVPWPSQEKLLKIMEAEEDRQHASGEATAKLKIVLLKARQIGGTAFAEALVAHLVFLNPRTYGIIASDHPDNSLKLWQVLLRTYDNLPGWMRPVHDAKAKATNFHLSELDSDIVVGSGNQKTTLGQGMNVDMVHLTEVSTWEYPEYIDEDLLPAFDSSRKHHTLCMFESTGAGALGNYFHDTYDAAVKGTSQFKPAFIAWYLRPGWEASDQGIELSATTKALAQRVFVDSGVELTRRQMAWYQVKRMDYESRGKLDTFYQEFPSTVEEAFQTGLQSVFPIELRGHLKDSARQPIFVADINFKTKKLKEVKLEDWLKDESHEKWKNRVIVWEWAQPGYLNIIGVDASYGMEGKDNAAVEVLRVGNKVRNDEQVAEWCGTCSPIDLATVAEVLGRVYADKFDGLPAKLAVECEPGSPGLITQIELMRRGYPHFYRWNKPLRQGGGYSKEVGWQTTARTRPLLTEGGVDVIKRKDLSINSPFFIKEMGSFVNNPNAAGKRHLEHAPGYHDDRIIALFIALYVAHEDDVTSVADERRRYQEQRNRPVKETVQFQRLDGGWAEHMQKWEDSLEM